MKAVILSALIVGVSIAQSTSTWDAKTACTAANEATVCTLSYQCCGVVSTLNAAGTTAVTPAYNRCINKYLADEYSAGVTVTAGATNYVLKYGCLGTTTPKDYTAYTTCSSDANCTSGYCCAKSNVTTAIFASATATTSTAATSRINPTAYCVPGDMGRSAGSQINYVFGGSPANGDAQVLRVCYAADNTNFYKSSAVLLKGALSMIVLAVISFAF